MTSSTSATSPKSQKGNVGRRKLTSIQREASCPALQSLGTRGSCTTSRILARWKYCKPAATQSFKSQISGKTSRPCRRRIMTGVKDDGLVIIQVEDDSSSLSYVDVFLSSPKQYCTVANSSTSILFALARSSLLSVRRSSLERATSMLGVIWFKTARNSSCLSLAHRTSS